MKKKVQIGILMVFLLTGCQMFQSHADKMRAIGEKVEEQGWEVKEDYWENGIDITYTLDEKSNEIVTFYFEKWELGSGNIYNKGYIAFRKEENNLQYGTLYSYDENEQSKYERSKETLGSIYEILPDDYNMICLLILETDEDDEGCSKEQKTELINLDKELTEILEEAGIDKEEFMDYVYWKYVPEGQQNKEQNE